VIIIKNADNDNLNIITSAGYSINEGTSTIATSVTVPSGQSRTYQFQREPGNFGIWWSISRTSG